MQYTPVFKIVHVVIFGNGSQKNRRKVAQRPQKNQLDFGGNPDHVRLGFGLRYTFHVTPGRTVLRLSEGRVIPRNTGCALSCVVL